MEKIFSVLAATALALLLSTGAIYAEAIDYGGEQGGRDQSYSSPEGQFCEPGQTSGGQQAGIRTQEYYRGRAGYLEHR